jgi:hypothetical protein
MNGVREEIEMVTPMKTDDTPRFCWNLDLEKARNVPSRDKRGYEMLLSWFETWRLSRQLPPAGVGALVLETSNPLKTPGGMAGGAVEGGVWLVF